jgi:hypothetical protein
MPNLGLPHTLHTQSYSAPEFPNRRLASRSVLIMASRSDSHLKRAYRLVWMALQEERQHQVDLVRVEPAAVSPETSSHGDEGVRTQK